MSGKAHNKRRNSLLMYEFLVRAISKSLVEDDKKTSAVALKILRRHYRPGTNLYKEFRLLNALAKTTVSSEHTAASILKEARTAADGLDLTALDREKSLLIRSINHMVDDPAFYDQHVHEYRTYATMQSLLNEWRSQDKDIEKIAKYEDSIMKWLLSEKTTPGEDHVISDSTSGTSRMLMKVMTKKLNEKYSDALNESQKGLVKSYAFYVSTEDSADLQARLLEVKKATVEMIEAYSEELNEQHERHMKTKLQETKETVLSEDLTAIDDATITRFMLYSKLCDELSAKE